jgi:alpha-beta hydrolase superfamily lysophospholipase
MPRTDRRVTLAKLLALLVVLAIVLAAIVPASTSGLLIAHPNPARDYGDAVSRAKRRQIADDRVAARGGRTILLAHGARTARAVVLLHGVTNSPLQFRALASQLFESGDNVYVPRLPHHGEQGHDAGVLGQLTAEELRASGDSAVDVAAGLGDTVVVLGLSAGGNIAAWAAQYRRDVARVVIIAPAIEMASLPGFVDMLVVNLSLRAPSLTHREITDSSWVDREEGWNSRGIAETFRLGTAVRKAAAATPPAVREITLLLNASDRTIKAAPALAMVRSWARHGARVSAYELPDSLRLPHDVVDLREVGSNPGVVYPVIVTLTHGERPAPWLRSVPITTK